MQSTILIVDDEPAIRELLVFTLASDGYDCKQAGDANEAQRSLTAAAPNLILLDWMLPGISGIEFTRRLKREAKTRDIPIIMLTAKGEEADTIRGLDSGADDFVTKPFSTRELLARVRAILRRAQRDTVQEIISSAGLSIDTRSHRITVENEEIELSPTEYRLLEFFLTYPERVFSRGQLLDNVWGDDLYIDERTVDVHIRRLRKVLAPHGHDRFIQTVRGVGYRYSTLTF